MKRYLAFYGAEYYPGGGWSDFVGDYETLEEAVAEVMALGEMNRLYKEPKRLWHSQWGQVVDSESKAEIWSA